MKFRSLITLATFALMLFGFAMQSAQAGEKITIAAADSGIAKYIHMGIILP